MEPYPSVTSEMKNRYVERRKADLATLKEALASKQFDVFARIGHTLKGNALSFGFEELGKIGEELERAGLAPDERGAMLALLAFKNWLAAQAPGGATAL